MEEVEVPVEKFQEEIQERVQEELAKHHPHAGLSARVAMSSAIFAVFAAISALLAGHHSNEAVIEQIRASDHWSHFQAKSIKAAVLESQMDSLERLGKYPSEESRKKVESYRADQEKISAQAEEEESASRHHLAVHSVLARAVTFFQIAITISAIAVLTHRKPFWWVSMVFGLVGAVSCAQGLLKSF